MPNDRMARLLEPEHDSSNAPPTPPPMEHVTPSHNPYEFITNPATGPKKKLLANSNSKKSRYLVVVAGGIGFIILIMLVMNLLGRAGAGVKDDYVSLAQQQAEMIRVSDVGIAKANTAEARNLAMTAKFTLLSEQPFVLKTAKKAGAKTDGKALALGRNSKTDAALKSADQSNKFDEVFVQTMVASLKKYQLTLKKIHDEASTKTTKDALAKDYSDIGTLVIGQSKSTQSQ